MKNSAHMKGTSGTKIPPRVLVWIVLASSVCEPTGPTRTTPCASGTRIVDLELSIGAYHIVAAAFRCAHEL
jgi:hypothetical protein